LVVTQALHDGADPNKGGEDGFTPLMTAAEAGHTSTVRILCQHPLTKINLANTYGQTALSFAAQNGRIEVVLELCAVKCNDGIIDFERRGNTGMTAAASARAGGHHGLADVIAAAARERQVDQLMKAVANAAAGQTVHDSLADRLLALFETAGLQPPVFFEGTPDFDFNEDDSRMCVVCMDAPIEAAAVPCFHAQYCLECASALHACAVCRGKIDRVQRIFLP
jgi:hypothetical protein